MHRSLVNFHVILSSCDKFKCLGCAAWIAKKFSVRNTFSPEVNKVNVSLSNIVMLESSPRVLYVTVRAPSLAFDVIVLHPPYALHKTEQCRPY